MAKEAQAQAHTRSQYWWLPYLAPTLGDRPTGSHSLTRDDFFVENSHFDVTEEGEGQVDEDEEEESRPTKGPEIISKSKVEISSPKSVEVTSVEQTTDDDKGSGEVKMELLKATPISEDLAAKKERIEPSLTTLSGDTVTLLPSAE